jgi:hypothetical protein
MTRLQTDTGLPANPITKHGRCSKCRYEYRWGLLEYTILPNQHMQFLCPSCRMDASDKESRHD